MILGGHKVEKSSKSRISLQIPIVNYNGNLEEITTFQLCDHLKSWSDKKFHYSFFSVHVLDELCPVLNLQANRTIPDETAKKIRPNPPPHSLSQITSFISHEHFYRGYSIYIKSSEFSKSPKKIYIIIVRS